MTQANAHEQANTDTYNHIDFLTVLPRLLPKINALASKFAAPCDYEDMVQEGLIALFESSVLFDPQLNIPFDAFALTCVRRRMISAAKKNAKFSGSHISDWEDSADLASTLPMPDEYALGKEGFETVKNLLINQLSDYELCILSLFLEGLSYSEIAKKINKSTKSVDNALTRVKTKLSRWLSRPGE